MHLLVIDTKGVQILGLDTAWSSRKQINNEFDQKVKNVEQIKNNKYTQICGTYQERHIPSQSDKQDSGSKSFEVVSWPQLGPYENNSIHPLLLQGLCKPMSSCFCNTSVPAQDSRNRAPLARVDMASKTQDQSLLKLYHGRSSDLMRIIRFILSCCKDSASPFLHVSATLQCQHKTQEIGPRLQELTWQARLRIKVF